MVVDSFFIKFNYFVGNAGIAKRCIPYASYYILFILKSKAKPYPLLLSSADTAFFIFVCLYLTMSSSPRMSLTM